ncbi:hypothetical protein SAMN04487965_2239 [Microbulbifer donghaiensis]|uniref:Spore Coat Protein U domain-containing protein n=1 Tax=Microbulbifer donghaiensis TaxID=494016 RepID=A0A1M5CLU3_9GAMM|nr:hypothetical protein [Microbulbifer donghaiensis]SHF55670.1 hypothetical protein SAMN04487965_2239 [Microbulbifer donghaiensis]
MNKNFIRTLAATAAFLASASTLAFKDGTAGSTSEGELNINLIVEKQISIAGFDKDLTLDSGNSYTDSENVCVGRFATDSYSVSFSGANANAGVQEFRLSDGAATPTYVIYEVRFDDDTDAADVTAVDATTGVSAGPYITTNNLNCTGAGGAGDTDNAQIQVSVSAAEINAAGNSGVSSFSDVLTVTVTAL